MLVCRSTTTLATLTLARSQIQGKQRSCDIWRRTARNMLNQSNGSTTHTSLWRPPPIVEDRPVRPESTGGCELYACTHASGSTLESQPAHSPHSTQPRTFWCRHNPEQIWDTRCLHQVGDHEPLNIGHAISGAGVEFEEALAGSMA